MAACVAVLGTYGVLMDHQYVSTSDAVISTYVLDVRTPIEGTLEDVPSTAGDRVLAGAYLGRVGNALIDRQHLDNLRITAEAAQSAADSLAVEHSALEVMRRDLLARASLHTEATSTRLVQEVDGARLLLSAKRTALGEADAELERGRKLVGFGVISRAAFDKLVSAQAVLADEVRAQRAAVASLQAQLEAMHRGVLAEPGTNNDVAYSVQRADELRIKIAENARDLAAALAQAQEAHSAVAEETRRDGMLGSSEVRAPSAGVIWKLHAINGEHVQANAPVFSLVDCNRQFVLAEVPQDRVSTILLNSKAEIKLTGDAAQRTGTVMTVSGEPEKDVDSKLAATPVRRSTDALATVVIRLDAPVGADPHEASCLVGRTARVRIPTQPTNLVSLWLSQRI